MGFENRKSKRVSVSFDIYFWPEDALKGIGHWGQVINLSESGMAFYADHAALKGDILRLEFGTASRAQPVRLNARVVYSELEEGKTRRRQLRVQFEDLSSDDRLLLKQHVLHVSNPALSAKTGWGKAYFPGAPPCSSHWRELSADEHLQLMQRKEFISARELVYLKKFQAFLQLSLGNPNPQNFRLLGTRPVRGHSVAWVELELESGFLHVLGESIWAQEEEKGRAESGCSVVGYHKEEAVKIEKASP